MVRGPRGGPQSSTQSEQTSFWRTIQWFGLWWGSWVESQGLKSFIIFVIYHSLFTYVIVAIVIYNKLCCFYFSLFYNLTIIRNWEVNRELNSKLIWELNLELNLMSDGIKLGKNLEFPRESEGYNNRTIQTSEKRHTTSWFRTKSITESTMSHKNNHLTIESCNCIVLTTYNLKTNNLSDHLVVAGYTAHRRWVILGKVHALLFVLLSVHIASNMINLSHYLQIPPCPRSDRVVVTLAIDSAVLKT